MPKPARMSDVAQLAGVSTMTVSRVLNGSGNVAPFMRDRVHAAIAQLQYRRNEVARSLRERHSRQIGVIVPNLYNLFVSSCLNSVGTVAHEHSYSLIFAASDDDAATELDEVMRMISRNVAGLLIIPTATPGAGEEQLCQQLSYLPVVALDRRIGGCLDCDNVVVDNHRGAYLATEHLIHLGHRNITFFTAAAYLYTMQARQSAYESAMRAAGLNPVIISIPTDMARIETDLCAIALAATPQPTAFFCATSLITRNILRGLKARGLQPPSPIALVGFDDFETADLIGSGITVIRQPVEQLGHIATEALFSRIENGESAIGHGREIVLPVELIVRGSCGTPGSGV